MMIKVTQDIQPIVGQFYLVRVAEVVIPGYHEPETYHVPIIGEAHSDPQLGVSLTHYHIDGRFIPTNHKYVSHENGLTNTVITVGDPKKEYEPYIKSIEWVRMKCKRSTTGIKPPDGRMFPTMSKDHRYVKWYDSMIGKSCKGKRCPHLGYPMTEQGGVLVCPLHGLTGCIETEVIIDSEMTTRIKQL